MNGLHEDAYEPRQDRRDGGQIARYLDTIDREDGELATLKGEYMQRCQGPRGRIKSVMAAAKEAGVNTVAFRATVAKHRAARKLHDRLENLEADDRYAFDMIQEALGEFGDTPLGAAALDRARPRERVLNIA